MGSWYRLRDGHASGTLGAGDSRRREPRSGRCTMGWVGALDVAARNVEGPAVKPERELAPHLVGHAQDVLLGRARLPERRDHDGRVDVLLNRRFDEQKPVDLLAGSPPEIALGDPEDVVRAR